MTQAPNASRFGMVLVSDLHIDPEAQRQYRPSWVKSKTSEFDVDSLGYIVVNKRPDGKLYVVDGQHRVALMREVGWGDQKIHAECFEGLTQAGEARLFRVRNDRRNPQPYDRFKIAVTEGRPEESDIDRIVRAYGLVVSDQSRDGHVVAVDALIRVYRGAGIASQKEGAAALGKTLQLLIRAWGKQPSSVNGTVVHGVGMTVLRYNGLIDEAEMAKKLAPFPGGPSGLLGRARAQREIAGRPVHHCVASLVVEIYNRGRRSHKLPAWESDRAAE